MKRSLSIAGILLLIASSYAWSLPEAGTVEALSRVDPGEGGLVAVSRWSTPGDEGGGIYRYEKDKGKLRPWAIPAANGVGGWMLAALGPVTVRQFGALGDGKNNDAPAFQKAIDFAAEGGGCVLVPKGNYRIESQIIVRSGVRLQGVGWGAARLDRVHGSILIVDLSQDQRELTAFVVEAFSTLEGLGFLYPSQSSDGKGMPVPMGWTISTNGRPSQDGILLKDLMLYNSYRGIYLDLGGQNTIENIYGNPIETGIRLNRQLDVSRIRDIHFWSYSFGTSTSVGGWIMTNGVALDVGKADQIFVDGFFAYGYSRGVWLRDMGDGPPWISFSNVLLDVCLRPFSVDKALYVQVSNVVATGIVESGFACMEFGKDVGESARVQVANAEFHNAIIGVYNRSNTGYFSLVNVSGSTSRTNGEIHNDNSLRQWLVVNEGSAQLKITNPAFLPKMIDGISGAAGTILDGMPMPRKGGLVLGRELMQLSSWKIAKEHASAISSNEGVLILQMDGPHFNEARFDIPRLKRGSCYQVSIRLQTKGVMLAGNSQFQLAVKMGETVKSLSGRSINNLYPEPTLLTAFFTPRDSQQNQLVLKWGGCDDPKAEVRILSLEVAETKPSSLSPQVKWLLGHDDMTTQSSE